MNPKTLNIFFSYGQDHNAVLVEMIKLDLEAHDLNQNNSLMQLIEKHVYTGRFNGY